MGRVPASPPPRSGHRLTCDRDLCVEITTFNDVRRRYLCSALTEEELTKARSHELTHQDCDDLGVECPVCREENN